MIAGLFVVLAGSKPSEDSAETNLMGEPAPTATGSLMDGASFDLARRKGDWVVLNFFQSSCIPCQQEHPELEKFVAAQQAAARRRPLLHDRLGRRPQRRGVVLRQGGR